MRIERESVWLSLQQLAELFGRDKSVISRHLKNIFATKELEREAVVAKTATVQQEGGREVIREIEYFNLDAIISVGYRVNSTHATRFRQWATRVLRQHRIQGYSLDRARFEQNATELEAALRLVQKAAAGEARAAIARLKADLIARKQASELFGNECGDAFSALLGNLEQTVFGEPAYPTIETKAAHLLYFVIKNHPFSDGNKRSGAF